MPLLEHEKFTFTMMKNNRLWIICNGWVSFGVFLCGRRGIVVTQLIQLFVSVLLYFVIFFGIAFILNMLLRSTWLMTALYPIVVILTVDNISLGQFKDVNFDHPLLFMEKMTFLTYFTNPISAFYTVFIKLLHITPVDIVILGAGLAGTIVSGFVVKILRRQGYQMF